MATAARYAGVTAGLSQLQDIERDRPARDARLKEARASQQTAEAKRDEYLQGAPSRKKQQDLEVEQLQNQVRTEQSTRLKGQTYGAFNRYEADGSTKHLNNFLGEAKANPAGQNIWGNWSRFDPLTRTSESEAMLTQAGITEIDEFFSDPELVKGMVMATDREGQHVLVDMDKLYMGTGYTQHMTEQELASTQQRMAIQNLMQGQRSADTNLIHEIAENEGMSIYEAATAYYQMKNTGKTVGSAVERVAEQLREDNPDMGYLESLQQAAAAKSPPTAAQKDLGASDEVRAQLDEVTEGDFFAADMNDPTTRRKVGPLITKLEKLTDKPLSTEDKRTARQLRSLTQLGGAAGTEITDAEAGPIDSVLRSLKKYMSNDVKGLEGAAAYETFRNVFRNALYGASLTATETAAFTAAAGSLKQQTGPVLQQLVVQMNDVKQQLQSIYAMNDEQVAYYYLGSSLEDIDGMVAAIEERVDYFKDFAQRENLAEDVKLSTTPTEKPSLDTIFGVPK